MHTVWWGEKHISTYIESCFWQMTFLQLGYTMQKITKVETARVKISGLKDFPLLFDHVLVFLSK